MIETDHIIQETIASFSSLLEGKYFNLKYINSSLLYVINIGSTSSFLAFPGASAYSASKFAVKAITDSLRLVIMGTMTSNCITFSMHLKDIFTLL